MGPARRVPWASKAELYELYEFLFSPMSDEASRKRGLARMNVYISSPSCPAFMYLLHNLLSAALMPPPTGYTESQAARLTFAMAIVRFVNGLVDPLQTGELPRPCAGESSLRAGPYARPISHIAASLNIPPHLIALRHRATHEDLPSLPVLQGAVGDCLDYLHHYSFLPLLAESSASSQPFGGQMGPTRGEELVRRWKRSMKLRLRDRDVRDDSSTGREVTRMKRDLERMIQRGEEGEVIEALCGLEGLVPTAKRYVEPSRLMQKLIGSKRSKPEDIVPPEASIMIWQPLIEHSSTSHPVFAVSLANCILSVLLSNPGDHPKDLASSSFRWTLATWLAWLCDTETSHIAISMNDTKDILNRLAHGLLSGDQTLRKLAKTLASLDSSLEQRYQSLLKVIPPIENGAEVHLDEQNPSNAEGTGSTDEVEANIKKLEDRMLRFQSVRTINHHALKHTDAQAMVSRAPMPTAPEAEQIASNSGAPTMQLDEGPTENLPGWRKLRTSEWTARPVGIFA